MSISIQELAQRSDIKFGTSGLRGLVSNLTDDVCFAYAKAFLQTQNTHAVAIGHDLRPSSPRISQACHAAAESLGIACHYIGALPTPALAFYCLEKKLPGIMVTGSHIPFNRNGIKFYTADGEITKHDEQAITNSQVNLDSPNKHSKPLPDLSIEAKTLYLRRYQDFIGHQYLSGKKIAIYQHSGVARDLLDELFRSLGAQTILLGRSDTFVPIDTEAVRQEDEKQASHWATEHSFDMLVSTDGDADRPLIADELGYFIRGDILGILTAQYLYADHIVTPISSNTAAEKSNCFKSVTRTKIGSPYVIESMESLATNHLNDTIVGYEANGGFLLGTAVKKNGRKLNPLPTRDALLPMLCLMGLSIDKHIPISQLTDDLPKRFTHSDRLENFPSVRSATLINLLQQTPEKTSVLLSTHKGKITKTDITDGLRLTFENEDIIHLRPSGNAPELRCYAESNSLNSAKQMVKECLKGIDCSYNK